MKKHFVTFFSPGTFVDEATTKPIDSWDIEAAKETARSISERYGATPYGFQFSTRERLDLELDSRVIAESPLYFLGGEVVTIETIRDRALPDERILLDNMEINGWDKVIFNYNSFKTVRPLYPTNIILEWVK